MAFSPEAIYERGHQEQTANQPRFYEMFRQLIPQGLAMCIEDANGRRQWMACAPWSRLEPCVFYAYDLAVPGEAGLHRIEFEEISFTHLTDYQWPTLYTKGWNVAGLRPIVDTEDEVLVRAWNEHSGRDPLPMPVL